MVRRYGNGYLPVFVGKVFEPTTKQCPSRIIPPTPLAKGGRRGDAECHSFDKLFSLPTYSQMLTSISLSSFSIVLGLRLSFTEFLRLLTVESFEPLFILSVKLRNWLDISLAICQEILQSHINSDGCISLLQKHQFGVAKFPISTSGIRSPASWRCRGSGN